MKAKKRLENVRNSSNNLLWIGLFFVVLAIAVLMSTGCDIVNPPPTATVAPTDVPATPVPTLDPRDWQNHPTTDTWPKTIDGSKVCYVQVAKDKSPLRQIGGYNASGKPVFIISTVKNLRPGQTGISSQRVIAKQDKFIMVFASGDVWQVSDKSCRPFQGDGGARAYLVMHEQVIDGIYIGSHPRIPLYALAGDVIYFDPWN
jgi:hypothetical protein